MLAAMGVLVEIARVRLSRDNGERETKETGLVSERKRGINERGEFREEKDTVAGG